jgi:hypothetical protein
MRTYDELLADLKLSKELGVPFELTPEEKARAFGDVEYSMRDTTARIKEMCIRYTTGLALSKSDIKEVKKYLKEKK